VTGSAGDAPETGGASVPLDPPAKQQGATGATGSSAGATGSSATIP
jgi:hypothetical protein